MCRASGWILPGTLPAVLADYNRLERIITNLLSNALKYSDRRDAGTDSC